MATISTEAQILTKQRVGNALAALNASPQASAAFREFFKWLDGYKKSVTLQLIPISDLTEDTNPLDGAVKVYAVYVKKQATATDSYYKIFDDATDDATTTDVRLALPLLVSGDEQIFLSKSGLDLAAGLVHGAYTAVTGANGATPSTSGDGPNGFVLVGE